MNDRIYDLNELARSNLHIHSTYSKCAKEEMTIESILEEADKSGLEMIAITDHFNSADCPARENNAILRDRAEKHDSHVKVLYGSELSAYGIGKYLDSPEVNAALDYRLYSYNHYHLGFWEHPEDKTPRAYAIHALRVLEDLFRSGRADCIAHPFIGRFIHCFDDKTLVTKALTDNELGGIMELSNACNVAWELNVNAIIADPEFGRRYWNIGKETGVVFYMGTDAHRLVNIDTRPYLSSLEQILGE